MIPSLHFVFRATGTQSPLSTREHSLCLWDQLQDRLPGCVALCLMPNHGHLIVPMSQRKTAEQAIRLSLLAFQRIVPSWWEPIPEPTLVPDIKHLRRQIRYVHLNPSRSRLTSDPLNWEFSTHWDYLGFSVGSISVPKVRDLDFSSVTHFHQFVSADSTTNVAGTPFLRQARGANMYSPIVSLDRVADLTLLLTRSPAEALRQRGRCKGLPRKLFYSLAAAAGYRNYSQLARYLNIGRQSVREAMNKDGAFAYREDLARQLLLEPRLEIRNLKNLSS